MARPQDDESGARGCSPATPHTDPDAEEVAGEISTSVFTLRPRINLITQYLSTSVLTVMREEGFDLQESAIRFSSSSGQKIMAIRRLLELKLFSS